MRIVFKNQLWLVIILFNLQYLYPHKDHKDRPAMPAIGILQGSIVDSVSLKPLEYASISLVELEHNELVTGGLSDQNGKINITEIPLGKYVAVMNLLDIKRRRLALLIFILEKGAALGKILVK